MIAWMISGNISLQKSPPTNNKPNTTRRFSPSLSLPPPPTPAVLHLSYINEKEHRIWLQASGTGSQVTFLPLSSEFPISFQVPAGNCSAHMLGIGLC